jgi:ketosteroid isomerase-like protein
MSERNVEVVREIYESFVSGDIRYDLLDPEIELDLSERVLNPSVYRGHEGARRFWSEVHDVWEVFETTPEEVFHTGDHVVAFVVSRGRGKGSGVEVESRAANLWTIREGVAISYRLYQDRKTALEVAGLA